MINDIIYWIGVLVVLGSGIFAICLLLWGIIYTIKMKIIKHLGSLYSHVQLMYFMKEILDKGYIKAMKDMDDEHDTD